MGMREDWYGLSVYIGVIFPDGGRYIVRRSTTLRTNWVARLLPSGEVEFVADEATLHLVNEAVEVAKAHLDKGEANTSPTGWWDVATAGWVSEPLTAATLDLVVEVEPSETLLKLSTRQRRAFQRLEYVKFSDHP
jgi:hypothetical protein